MVKIRFSVCVLVLATVFGIATTVAAGSLIPPVGYVCSDTVLDIPTGGWFGGFDFLPNGNFVISDGYSVREITRQGATVRTLYVFPDPDPYTPEVEAVFGSFVKYDSTNDKIYFGESSLGTIRSISASGGSEELLATLSFNYDMDLWNGVPYVVAGNKIYRLSVGGADHIATVVGPSGPLIFDAYGNLIYGTGDYDWSTPNDQSIYRWSAVQIAGAGGGIVLGLSDAVVLAAGVNGPGGFALNSLGELFYTDSVGWPASIRILRNGTTETFAETYVPGQFPWTTTLRYNSATGEISAAVSWAIYDNGRWLTSSVISTLTPVPEPSSLIALCSLLGLAASSKLIRSRSK